MPVIIARPSGDPDVLGALPTLPNGGLAGEQLVLINRGSATITLSDESELAGSKLHLQSASVSLAPNDALTLIWDGNGYYELSRSSQSALESVDIRDFGAKGDGLTDDTSALFAALEQANGVDRGTWETGGDVYASYATRKRRALLMPRGDYVITRPIPVRFRGVSLAGTDPVGPTEPSEDHRVVIYAEHTGNIIDVDGLYNVNGFFLKNIALRKRNAFVGTGQGLNVHGANYVFGLHLMRVNIANCVDGIRVVCQDLADGTGAMADLVLAYCQVANNSGFGLTLRGHAAIGGIFASSIVANSLGGVRMGVKGFSISNTDFEGQENPLAVTYGSASEALVVGPGNYFEGNPVTATPGLISLGLVDGFRVEGNQFSGNSLVPRVYAATCANGWIDEAAQLIGCSNVVVRNGLVLPTAGTGENELSYTYNPNRLDAPKAGALVLPGLNERGGGNAYFKANGRTLAGQLIETPDYRYLINGFSSVSAGDYVFFAFSVKYLGDLPHGNPLVQLLGDIGAGVTILKSWGFYVPADSLAVGDNVNFVVGMKNTYGATISTVSAYFSPYGNDATPGLGARLGQVLQWRQSSNVVPNVDPLALVNGNGTAAPTSGDWGVGDRVFVVPTAGGAVGHACIVGGAPGTWQPFGQLGSPTTLITAAVGNVGGGEDDLQTTPLAADSLAANGRGVRIRAWGTTANNAATKTLKLKFGSATILTNSLTANVAGKWNIEAIVTRTGADAQKYVAELREKDSTAIDIESGTATEDDGAAITIKCTGTATSDNDIVQEGLLVEYL